MALTRVWKPKKIKLNILGKEVEVNGAINTKTNQEIIDLEDVARLEMKIIAENYDLNERNLSELLLLFAPLENPQLGIKDGKIRNKYTFNKMLFYLKEELKKKKLEKIFPIDEFGKGRAGPIPIHLHEDIEEIKKERIN